jgi:hypothetical protein
LWQTQQALLLSLGHSPHAAIRVLPRVWDGETRTRAKKMG